MALGKEIINEKGVKTTYHRIDSISMVEGIKVIVKSYTDESYRQQEKENEALIEKQEAIKAELQIEMEKEGEDYQKEKVIALTEENNAIGFPIVLDLAVFIHEFQYPFDKETAISYKGVYQKLKQEPIFYGSSDILEQDTVLN